MILHRVLAWCAPTVAISLFVLQAAGARPYELPAEEPVALPSGPGAELTAAYCSACHSIDYVTTQPRGKGPQFWKDAVNKMVNVYGAPIAAEEAATISTYLATTYGPPA